MMCLVRGKGLEESRTVPVDEAVLRLDIPMADPVRVEVFLRSTCTNVGIDSATRSVCGRMHGFFLRHQAGEKKNKEKERRNGRQTDEACDQLSKVEVGNLLVDANVGSCKGSVRSG